eukprot:c34396_g1_i1 orf=203-1276(-)
MGSPTVLPSISGETEGSAQSAAALSCSLTRQASIYSLTLDAFQNMVNEPEKYFGSMNMDEFLKSICITEDNQFMSDAMTSRGASGGDIQPGGIACQHNLHYQGNLSLPPTLRRRRVEEVWDDIQRNCESNAGSKRRHQQGTLGEMTLEDFPGKVSTVIERKDAIQMTDATDNVPCTLGMSAPIVRPPAGAASAGWSLQPTEWLNYAQQYQQLLLQAEASAAAGERICRPTDCNLHASHLYDGLGNSAELGISAFHSDLSLSPANTIFSTYGKRTITNSLTEKSVQRRQRRMIKNRESAARSRARKQAYTVELEAEVTHLKEENMRLMQLQSVGRHLPLKQSLQQPNFILRRTRSTCW